MNRKFLAAALVAPMIAFGPATAWAHHCGGKHHGHHARSGDETYGSSNSMHKRSSTRGPTSQERGTGGSSGMDQGSSDSSKRQGL